MNPDTLARNRWLTMVAVRLAATAGAVLGVILIARASDTQTKVLGTAIVIAALYVMAVIPTALAHRWRTPPSP